jgi:CRISPR-associated protein Csx16
LATILVTRHIGSLFWAYHADVPYDRAVEHLDPATVEPSDVVIGTLPLHLAAQVCARGARYQHLVIDMPPGRRGEE